MGLGLALVVDYIVYNADQPACLPALKKSLRAQGEQVLLEDFNLHYPNWNNHGRCSYHKEADGLLDIQGNKPRAI